MTFLPIEEKQFELHWISHQRRGGQKKVPQYFSSAEEKELSTQHPILLKNILQQSKKN